MVKLTYDLEVRHDIPLFTKSPNVTNFQLQNNKKAQKNNWNNMMD